MLQDVVDQMHVQLQEHAPEAVESADGTKLSS